MSARSSRAVYNLDSELRFMSANEACLSMWDKRLEDIIGQRMPEVFPQIVGSEGYEAQIQAMRSLLPFRRIIHSVILDAPVELEIYPSREGLRISFAPVDRQPGP